MTKDNCIFDPQRKQFGYGQRVWNRMKEYTGEDVTRGKFTNVVRNLGVDDERMINLRDSQGNRFFGDNIKDVGDIDFSKKPIPQNTVVRAGDKYYVSNKETDTAPSRWIRDEINNELRPHSDWDAIGVNQTGMERYVRESDGLFRKAEAGETGSYLNIQNAVKGDPSKSKIISDGIDAIEIDGRYKLIDESSQAVRPNSITNKPSREALSKSNTEDKPTVQQIAEKLQDNNIQKSIAYSIAGGVVGSMADEDGEFAGSFWGGAAGLLLGTPRVRSKIATTFNKTTDDKGKDAYDKAAVSVTRQEKYNTRFDNAKSNGYKGAYDDERSLKEFEDNQRELDAARERGESGWFKFFDTTFFKSIKSYLEDMGPTGSRLAKTLASFEDAPRQMYGAFSRIESEVFGEANTKQIIKDTQLNFIKSLDVRISDDDALQSFGASVDRIVKYQARIEDGQFKYVGGGSADQIYSDDVLREIDEALLRDEQANKIVDVTKRFYEEESGRAVRAIESQISEEFDKIGSVEVRNYLNNIYDSGMTFKQFESSIENNEELLKVFKKVKTGDWGTKQSQSVNKDSVKRIKSLIEDRYRFKQLEGKYVPQKWSSVKESAEKKKWMERNKNDFESRGLNSQQIDNEWEFYKGSRILALNNDKWVKMEVSDDGVDLHRQYFSSYSEAKAELERYIDSMREGEPRRIVRNDISDEYNIKDYIGVKQTSKGEKHYLTTPEYRKDIFPNGLFEQHNAAKYADINQAFVTANLAGRSNFFDRPRLADVPTEFRETNLEKLAKFYSDDMGVRVKAIENGMYDSNSIRENWLKNIQTELKERGVTGDKLDKKIRDVEQTISTMQGLRGERKIALSEADRQSLLAETKQKAKNDSLLNSLAKLATGSFNYATTLYSMFTPMILGPFIGSWKGIAREYKNGVFAPKRFSRELKAFTDELEKMNIIQKKFQAYAPEYKDQYKAEMLGDTSSFRRKLSESSDSWVDFTANLSLARVAGVDPERLGIMRLAVGNMLDISGAEAGLTTMGVFTHVEDLIKAGRQIIEEGADGANIGRTRYTYSSLRREFEQLGIDDMERFVRHGSEFTKFSQYMRGNESVKAINPKLYKDYIGLTNRIIDQYHGRTKMSRPLDWVNNVWGRALSRYSVYAQNFGVQTTATRIYRPLREWSDRYKMKDESFPMFRLAYAASRGDDATFKKVFGDQWEDAYNDFPVDAVNSFFKIFGTLAVGKAMMITRGGILDMTEITTNEALGNDDYEAWRLVNKELTLGTDADTGEAFTFGDVFSGDVQGYDLFKAFTGSMAMDMAQLGYGGRWAQVFSNDLQYTQGGIAEMTPLTGLPNDAFERVGGLLHAEDYRDVPRNAAREITDFLGLRATPFGTMSGARQGIVNSVFQKPKNRNINWKDSSTGIDLDVQYYEL